MDDLESRERDLLQQALQSQILAQQEHSRVQAETLRLTSETVRIRDEIAKRGLHVEVIHSGFLFHWLVKDGLQVVASSVGGYLGELNARRDAEDWLCRERARRELIEMGQEEAARLVL